MSEILLLAAEELCGDTLLDFSFDRLAVLLHNLFLAFLEGQLACAKGWSLCCYLGKAELPLVVLIHAQQLTLVF